MKSTFTVSGTPYTIYWALGTANSAEAQANAQYYILQMFPKATNITFSLEVASKMIEQDDIIHS